MRRFLITVSLAGEDSDCESSIGDSLSLFPCLLVVEEIKLGSSLLVCLLCGYSSCVNKYSKEMCDTATIG